MRKYVIVSSVAVFVFIAVSVFALQGRDAPVAASNEVAPKAVTDSGSGCGSGCGSSASAGCGSASGGCGAEAVDPAQAADRIDQIKAYLLDYYTNERGLIDITVDVESFGCHEEAVVKQAGRLIEKLSINGSRITKIEG